MARALSRSSVLHIKADPTGHLLVLSSPHVSDDCALRPQQRPRGAYECTRSLAEPRNAPRLGFRQLLASTAVGVRERERERGQRSVPACVRCVSLWLH